MVYVWCDDNLLSNELNYLNEEGFISCPPITEEVLAKGEHKIKILPKGRTKYIGDMQERILKRDSFMDSLFKNCIPFASNKTIFLAHKFSEKDLIDQVKLEIKAIGFAFKEGKVEDLGFISEDILNKIKESGFFLALLTKVKKFDDGTHSTSPWVLMEIGTAIAYGRQVLIMVEEGVDKK